MQRGMVGVLVFHDVVGKGVQAVQQDVGQIYKVAGLQTVPQSFDARQLLPGVDPRQVPQHRPRNLAVGPAQARRLAVPFRMVGQVAALQHQRLEAVGFVAVKVAFQFFEVAKRG